MKQGIFAFFCLWVSVNAWAQDSALVVRPKPAVMLKICPLHLMDPDNTLTLGAEVPLSPRRRTSIQQEVGFGISELSLFGPRREGFDRLSTWRFRSQLRLMLSRKAWPNGFYGALEFLQKRVNQFQTRSVGRECSNGTCAFFEITSEPRLRRVNAFHLKFGFQNMVSDRFSIDAYLGFGVRSLLIREPGQTNLETQRRDWLFSDGQPGLYYPIPSMSAGFQVGYLIGGPVDKKNHTN